MDRLARYDDELIVQSASSSPAHHSFRNDQSFGNNHLTVQSINQSINQPVNPSSRVPRDVQLDNRIQSISVSNQQEDLLTVRSKVESTNQSNDQLTNQSHSILSHVNHSSRWADNDRPPSAVVLSSDERNRGEIIEFEEIGVTIDVETSESINLSTNQPKGLTTKVITGTIATLLFTVVYLPFTLAILTQSCVQKRGILPIDHEKELTPGYWKFSLSMFLFMFSFPFVLIYGVLSDAGIWSIYNNNIRSAVPFTMLFAMYLALLVILHFMTVFYAYLRVDLRSLKRMDMRFSWRSISHMFCTLSIIFETFQLNSPYLTATQLGLQFPATTWHNMLDSIYNIFRIGQWEIVEVTTFVPSFWVAFGVVFVYAVLLGYGIQSDMQPTHRISPILFEFIPGTLYFSIVGRLLETFNCDPASDGSGNYHLRSAISVDCWDNSSHKSLAIAALMALLFYSGSANFVACYRGDAGSTDNLNVKFKPVYLVTERTLRDLFAITTALISDRQLSRSLGLVITSVLLGCTIYIQPCSVPTLGRLKILSQMTVTLTLFMSFLPAMFRTHTRWFDDNDPALIVFGWCMLFVLYVLYEMYEAWRLRKVSNKVAAIECQKVELSPPAAVEQPRTTGSIYMGHSARRASNAIGSVIRDASENISQVRGSSLRLRHSVAQLSHRSQQRETVVDV